MKDIGFYIDETAALTIPQLRSKLRRYIKKYSIKFAIIDYLQLMCAPDKKGNREQEISKISRDLKSLAKEFEMPILALSQLNRSVAEDEEPDLRHLRESGAIEQDADMIIFLFKPPRPTSKRGCKI